MNVTLVPRAGLCNRINAIISGLIYQRLHPENKVSIYWHKSSDCYCRFDDLFKQLPRPLPQVKDLKFSLKITPGTKQNLFFPNITRRLFYDFVFTPDMDENLFEVMTKKKKNIYVNTYNSFIEEKYLMKYKNINSSVAKVFRPTNELQSRIDSITDQWDNNVIGLHIRRTDNAEAIRATPLDYFHYAIRKEIDNNCNIRFYLATDDVDLKTDLYRIYGSRIISPSYCLERNSTRGMKDAVVDLFCLGLTNKIYGSAASSYTGMAAKLYDRELILK